MWTQPLWPLVALGPLETTQLLDFECDVPNIRLVRNIWMPRHTSPVVFLVGDTDGFREVRGTGKSWGAIHRSLTLQQEKPSPGALGQRSLTSGEHGAE